MTLCSSKTSLYFNPRAPCGARLGVHHSKVYLTYFNPRAPCGARQPSRRVLILIRLFQPTRPLRGATCRSCRVLCQGKYFNPRAPCGARPVSEKLPCSQPAFQPTRPLRGATKLAKNFAGAVTEFQPTRPLRGATWRSNGEPIKILFQPTRPLRGATTNALRFSSRHLISTHAPLAGRDPVKPSFTITQADFNPRAPCGARPADQDCSYRSRGISTHAPLAGRDQKCLYAKAVQFLFQPTRPLRGATSSAPLNPMWRGYFNPRAPCGARLDKGSLLA